MPARSTISSARTVAGARTSASGRLDSSRLRLLGTEATVWHNKVRARGGAPWAAEVLAHDDAVTYWSANGVLASIRRLNTFGGGTLNAATVPLVNSVGYPEDRPVKFVPGDFVSATGLTPDGSTKFVKTGALSGSFLWTDFASFFWGKSFEQASGTKGVLGSFEGGAGFDHRLHVIRPLSPLVGTFVCGAFSDATYKEARFYQLYSRGFIGGSSLNTGPMTTYFNGNWENRQVPAASRPTTPVPVNRECYVFGLNLNNALTSPSLSVGYAYGLLLGVTEAQMLHVYRGLRIVARAQGRVTDLLDIATWGDSLTAGTGGTSYPAQLWPLLEVDRAIYNGGVGGETSTQIADRAVAAASRAADVTVIWIGHVNFGAPATVRADAQRIIDALTGTKRFLVLSVLNGTGHPLGSADYDTIIALNQSLAALYPDNYFDLRAYLVSQYIPGNPADEADHANDVPPTSLRSDAIHLNTAGYLKVSQQVRDFVQAKGW